MIANRLILFIALTAALPVCADEWSIARSPELYGDLRGDDVNSDAAVSADKTLIVWQNVTSIYPQTHAVWGRITSPSGMAPPFRIANGVTPHVVEHEDGWLVAHAINGSRFNTYEFPDIVIRTIGLDGTVGPQVVLNRSNSNYSTVSALEPDGDGWIVGYRDAHPKVAFLNRDLTLRTSSLTLGRGTAPAFARIADTWWAFHADDGGAVATELLPDGTAGRRHTAAGFDSVTVASSGGRIVAALSVNPGSTTTFSEVTLTEFTPDGGFAPKDQSFDGRLFDLSISEGEVIAIHAAGGYSTQTLTVSRVDADASLQPLWTVEQGGPFIAARIRDSSEGPMLLISASGTDVPQDAGLFRILLDGLPRGEIDWSRAEPQSSVRLESLSDPFIVSTGDEAVVFWTQQIDRNSFENWNQRVDSSGAPIGRPQRLPFRFGGPVAGAATGERILLSWVNGSQIMAVALDGNGSPLGDPVVVGEGVAPALAAGRETFFLVWEARNTYVAPVRGTPLRSDASPHVPGGFDILPSFTEAQTRPVIAALDVGFMLLWEQANGLESVVITDSGTPLSSSRLQGAPTSRPVLAASARSALAAWAEGSTSITYAFGGARPFEGVRLAQAPSGAEPIAVERIAEGRFALAFVYGGQTYVQEISMDGAYITGVSPPRLLTRSPVRRGGVAVVGGNTIATWEHDDQVWAGAADLIRRRGVIRR